MKTLLIILGSLFALFLAFFGISCCKIAGEEDEDAQRCFEQWQRSKQEEEAKGGPNGGAA